MTTNHHTPILAGESNSPDTINTRLSTIDAALVAQDNLIDNLIIDSGTSDAETIAARNGYDILDDRLSDLVHRSDVMLVDAGFEGLTSANRFTTLSAALAACTGGETILIAPGILTENATVADDNITIIGSGKPQYDAGTGRLVGGTIIRGTIGLGSQTGIVIRDLGVDRVGVNSVDCISSSNVTTADNLNRHFENLILLGNGYDALAHGLYGAGNNLTISNVDIYACHHGIAIHGSNVNINNVHFYRCSGTSLVIKAKGSAVIHRVNVNNIVLEGDSGSASFKDWAGPIAIQCEDAMTVKYVNITNVSAYYCNVGVLRIVRTDATGSVSDVSLVNVHSDANQDVALEGDYYIETGNNIKLTNCRSTNRAAGIGFVADPSDDIGDVYLYSATADGVAGTLSSGDWKVRELNSQLYRPEGIYLQPTSGNRGAHVNGAIDSGSGVSVTGASTPVAALSNGAGGTIDYAGIVIVWARSATTSTANSAVYVYLVMKGSYSGGVGLAVEIQKLGQTTGAAAAAPSFTFTVDQANNHLEATPVASTSGTFYFSFTALGSIKVAAI